MKSMLKVIFVIGLCSASTFLLIQVTGLISIDKIELWFSQIKAISPIYLAILIILLMIIDLFISIPTLATIILAGYFMGFLYGALSVIAGLLLMGSTGYFLGSIYGEKILHLILKDKNQRQDVRQTFNEHGFLLIIISRAIPIFPEITTCLAGISGMPYLKFLIAWSISIIPYTAFAAYAGSISSLNNPKPAIFAAIIIACILWSGWFLFNKTRKA